MTYCLSQKFNVGRIELHMIFFLNVTLQVNSQLLVDDGLQHKLGFFQHESKFSPQSGLDLVLPP